MDWLEEKWRRETWDLDEEIPKIFGFDSYAEWDAYQHGEGFD